MDKFVQKDIKCPVEQAIEIISKKWISKIIWYLYEGTKRFNELERRIPGMPRRVLVQHLRELELCGIVKRVVYAQVPPKVEYSLTEMGDELAPIFQSIGKWAYKYQEELKSREQKGVQDDNIHSLKA